MDILGGFERSRWAFWVVLALSGCGSRPPDEGLVQETAALTCEGNGLVRDAAGAPVAGAKIEVRGADGRRVVARDTTAADGTFELDVRSGIYDVLVVPRAGFEPQRFPRQTLERGSRLELILAGVGQINLSGHILDSDGNPMAQVIVCAGEACSTICSGGGCSITDASGAFAVTVEFGQSLRITDSLNGATFNLVRTIDRSQGPTLELRVPKIVVTGTVIDLSGNPVPSQTIGTPGCHAVAVDQFTGTSCPPFYQFTDAAGRFQFVTLPGEVDLFAIGTPGGYLSQTLTEDTDVTIQLASQELLSGRVADRDGNGVAGQIVCVRHDGCIIKGCAFICTGSDSDGHYQLLVPAGSDNVDLSSSPTGVLGQYRVEQVIDVSQPTNVDFTLQNRFVTGQVLDSNGASAPNVTVSAKCFTGNIDGIEADICSASQVTDQDGRFRLPFAAPGDVIVTAVGASTSASVPVSLSADTDVVIRLPNLGAASGQVLDGTGHGVPGMTVYYAGSNPPRLITATTDADGRYQMTLTPDAYTVTVQGTTDPGDIVTVFADEPVVVPSTPLVIRLAPTRALAGQLLGQDGQPLAGIEVDSQCAVTKLDIGTESLCGGGQVTDASGRFALDASLGASLSLTIDTLGQAGIGSVAVNGILVRDDTDVTLAVQQLRGERHLQCP